MGRRLYTSAEDERIVAYLLGEGYSEGEVTSNTVAKDIVRKKIVKGRTWESVKERIKKHLREVYTQRAHPHGHKDEGPAEEGEGEGEEEEEGEGNGEGEEERWDSEEEEEERPANKKRKHNEEPKDRKSGFRRKIYVVAYTETYDHMDGEPESMGACVNDLAYATFEEAKKGARRVHRRVHRDGQTECAPTEDEQAQFDNFVINCRYEEAIDNYPFGEKGGDLTIHRFQASVCSVFLP